MLTTAVPQAMASMSTIDRPSSIDDTAKTRARAIQANGFTTKPGSPTAWPMPSSRTSAASASRSRPSPRIARRAGRDFTTSAKARNRRGEVLLADEAAGGEDHRHVRIVEPGVIRRRHCHCRDVLVVHRVRDHPHPAGDAGHLPHEVLRNPRGDGDDPLGRGQQPDTIRDCADPCGDLRRSGQRDRAGVLVRGRDVAAPRLYERAALVDQLRAGVWKLSYSARGGCLRLKFLGSTARMSVCGVGFLPRPGTVEATR